MCYIMQVAVVKFVWLMILNANLTIESSRLFIEVIAHNLLIVKQIARDGY